MKKIILIAVALLLAVSMWSQEPSRSIYQVYPDVQTALTKAPDGYKPFYISHFGRHGSRYLSSEKMLKPAYDGLKSADARGLLTSRGKELLGYIEELYLLSDGLWGQLSSRGAREHRGIAARMNKNFPLVLRDSISVYVSNYPRCLVSMSAATGELSRLNPGAEFTYHVGDRYQNLINPRNRPVNREMGSKVMNDYLAANLDIAAAMDLLFTDRSGALRLIAKPIAFFKSVYSGWAIREAVLLQPFRLEDYIGQDAANLLSRAANMSHYQNMGFDHGADTLLRSIISRADEAVVSGKRYADLRYAHDNGLMRVLIQMGVEGYPAGLSKEQAMNYDFGQRIPMASNLQIILYKNRKGEVLVKFLVNESEARLAGLSGGPYYQWAEVSEYLKNRIQ